MTTATNIQLPFLKDTGLDGENIHNKRMDRNVSALNQKIHNIDIKQILVDGMTPTGERWDTKDLEIR